MTTENVLQYIHFRNPISIQYNTYDNVDGVSRCCLQGRVRVGRSNDGALYGLPLNPRGRSGLAGKGLLPHWGPNHMIILALTRRLATGDEIIPRLQVAMLKQNQCFCLPWVCGGINILFILFR